ncbi:adenylosuccinate synthase [Haliangium ochraceum]|uniref:Adenylosuccinate synthetase n=1 Tax=Haliangium ochraceum (strain DSM 14365 / JCM 11303 / SMP-2) TaxID=502025 RepID=D0LNQ7_HALO1|nr:adenylosuccinate synthase [Haliangium ochraceum]ACY16962.1 adenylosuccinate synthetase [Haliangium ochraceum DSM 14365]
MAVVVVVGAQWGDEGKGKIVDLMTESASAVVRFGGGANAGHTLVVNGHKLVTHLIPSGVLHAGTRCVLGDGMVIDPATLLEEMAACRERGLLAADELRISERAHVILPYHRIIEGLREQRPRAIGTTRRGIGPAYEAKYGRRGVRMRDLLRPERLRSLVAQNLDELAPLISHYGGEMPAPTALDEMVAEAARAGEQLAPYITNTGYLLDAAIRAGDNVLLEGAQGALLDIDHGTYPFVTSSSTVAGGAAQGAGIGPTRIDGVIGISKAYVTRVGAGPFPTELPEAEAEALRTAGAEFGATTGRPRRCGWLDIPALRLAARINGLSGLALTKLDVLSGLGEVSMCTGYRLEGELMDELPTDPVDIERAEPVMQRYTGWSEDLTNTRNLSDLPSAARAYVDAIEELVGVPLILVSVGPDRDQTIELRDAFS